MAQKCEGCKKEISSKDLMTCSACPLKFHHVCLNISIENFRKQSKDYKSAWKCPQCRSSDRKGDNTPVRASVSASTPLSPASSDAAMLDAIKDQVDSAVKNAVTRAIKTEFDELRADMSALKDVKSSIEFMCKEFERLNLELIAAKKTIADLQVDNAALKGTVNDLSSRVILLEQYSRENNIEISGLPENKSENLVNVVTQIIKTTSCSLKESDILTCTRIRKMDANSARPRSVVVKLASAKERDTLIAAVVKHNKFNSEDKLNTHKLGYGGPKAAVYVTEHLSPYYKKLHAETRKIARDRGFRYIWIRNGRIFVRKDDSAPAKQILSRDNLMLL